MKGLVFILAIGLLLPFFADFMKPNKIKAVLCSGQSKSKMTQICSGFYWIARVHHPYDPIQASDDNDYFKETDMKKVQGVNDDGIQQLESPYGQQLFYNDHNQYEQMPDDFKEYISATERDSTMQRALLNINTNKRLNQQELAILSKCCERRCSNSDLSTFCRP